METLQWPLQQVPDMIANRYYYNVYMNILTFVQFGSVPNYIKSIVAYPRGRKNWREAVKASMAACQHGTYVWISL
jgi:hypothetical protein